MVFVLDARIYFDSPPSHVVFQNLIPLLLTVVGLTYIGKTLSPMETHHASVWAFLFATVIYWSILGLMIAKTFDGETCSQILSYVLFISGTFSCASLFSILLPNLLGQFVLHVSLPLILAVAALFYFCKRIKIAIGDNLNSQRITDSFDWVLNKFNSARGWVQDNLNSQTIENSFDWVRNKFNFARGWVRDNFNSQTIAISFDWVQNKFNSARGWVQDNLNSQKIANSFDWVQNKFNSTRGWVQRMQQQQHLSSLPTTSSLV
ncbi:unnamed protein product [Camellia sinensis]